MAFGDMVAELRGVVPKVPFSYLKTLINRAWREVRESQLWSFNLFESNWISPPPITVGNVTVVQGSSTIQFDATATAAINAFQIANPYVLVTQLQFRIGIGGIYSLIAYNQINGSATLDRPFADPSFSGGGGGPGGYLLYQLYYPAPFKDFLTWYTVRNPQMFLSLGLTRTRAWIDERDPQRSWYQFPSEVVPYGYDIRGQGTNTPSATLGFPLFELWGQPITPFTYQCYGIRRGTDLVQPTDTLPMPIGEDLVLAKARAYVYEWAEANRDISPRSTGPDFRFLIGATSADYKKLLILYRKQDREFVNAYFSVRDPGLASHAYGYYNTIAGVAGPYTQL